MAEGPISTDIGTKDATNDQQDNVELAENQNDAGSTQEKHPNIDVNLLEIDKMISESIGDKRPVLQESQDAKRPHLQKENDLDLQFEKAIEDHHRELSNPPESPTQDHQSEHNTSTESTTVRSEANDDSVHTRAPVIDEKGDLALIAKSLEEATESNKKNDKSGNDDSPDSNTNTGSDTTNNNSENHSTEQPRVLHEGISIPANSELLNTSSALAAYNALSSQMPPLAVLTNAHLAALPLPVVAPDYLPPRIQLLINTLPTLDNLATQLLRIVAIGPYQKIIDLASNQETPAGATYRDLTSLFEFTKRLYSEEDPFLTVEHLAPGMWKEGDITPSIFRSREQSIESTLRKVNLATFLAATLGTIEVGFFYLNESFLDVYCPANNLDPANSLSNMGASNMSLQSGVNTTVGDKVGKLLKPQAVLYLDLKTQAYISAIEAGERSREEILEDILPQNMEEVLLSRRGTKALSPTEMDFIDRCKARKETLLNYPEGQSLSEEYEWFSFLKDLFDFVSKNMGYLIWGKRGRSTRERVSKQDVEANTPHSMHLLNSTSPDLESARVRDLPKPSGHDRSTDPELRNQEVNDITNALLPSEILEQQIHLCINPNSGLKSIPRRPWSREEEKALRHALELKGPQWSVILELFGNGGKISEALKNRTQVQLKDKARNWKMFFLKSGLPVPAYLQKVTGDLERDDKNRATKRLSRSKKTAAAPVPSVQLK